MSITLTKAPNVSDTRELKTGDRIQTASTMHHANSGHTSMEVVLRVSALTYTTTNGHHTIKHWHEGGNTRDYIRKTGTASAAERKALKMAAEAFMKRQDREAWSLYV